MKIFKRVALLFFIFYIFFCQSCLTFRLTHQETKNYFQNKQQHYIDSTILIDKYSIHYIETGNKNKPTIFFIHGSPGSWEAFKEYLIDSNLLLNFRMISIDRPGFGYSNFGHAQNLFKQSEILSKFILKMENDSSVFLVGHSIAGAVAVSLACDTPNKIKEIVILAGAVDPKAEEPEKWRPILKTPPFRYLIPRVLSTANDELWWLKKDLIQLQKDLPKLKTKVLIIHGSNDQLVPYKNVFYLQNQLKNAADIQLITIEKANHFIPWSHYQIIKNELLKLN